MLVVLALVVSGVALNWRLATPSHDRDWRADYARLPTVESSGAGYLLGNIRNWSYAPDGSASEMAWFAREVRPDELVQSYFIVEPFGGNDAIAHTMLGFEFSDGTVLVASVEARREKGESYQPIRAALQPIFEYLIIWTTERDMFGNSEFMTGDALYLYPLAIPPDQQRAVLVAMLGETAEIMAAPRWYNTLFSNCTNVLARTVNDIAPGAVPFDISWNLPGYAAEFLFDQGMLERRGNFEETRAAAHVSPHIAPAYSQTDAAAFSAELRAALADAQ